MNDNNEEMRLADYLPYEFRKKNDDGSETDALRFLKAFDRILLGKTAENNVVYDSEIDGVEWEEEIKKLENIEGLEEIIANQADLFDPAIVPDDFLPWLSQWVALSLRADIGEKMQRVFIARIVPLYKMRGTKENMIELLEMFTGKGVVINDSYDNPLYFTVYLNLNDVKAGNDQGDYDRAVQQAHSVINMAKPAHTCYDLIPKIDAFRIGALNECPKDSREKKIKDCPIILGRNTRLGEANWIINNTKQEGK